MRRRLLIAGIFPLAGAVVNVAVAWGCAIALSVDPDVATNAPVQAAVDSEDDGQLHESLHLWILQRPAACRMWAQHIMSYSGYTTTTSLTTDELLSTVRGWSVSKDEFRDDVDWTYGIAWTYTIADARGWPLLALAWRTTGQRPNIAGSFWSFSESRRPSFVQMMMGIPIDFDLKGGVVVPPNNSNLEHWALTNAALPVRPVWPGFAVNTVFYAALLWVLACGPFALRRIIRTRRGLCPACAYPVGEAAVCTECGKALTGRREVTT